MRVIAGTLLALLAVGAGWFGAQSFGWRTVAQVPVVPTTVTSPKLDDDAVDVSRNFADDAPTLADDVLGDTAVAVPASSPENARVPAHQHLDLGLPAPDTSPALRPEMLAKLLN